MAKFSLTNGPGLLISAVGVAGVAGASFIVLSPGTQDVPGSLAVIAPEAPGPEPSTPPAAAPSVAQEPRMPVEDNAVAEPEDGAPVADEPSAVQDDDEGPLPAPSFDLVRAEADGTVLVAGMAAPGDRLRIDVDGITEASGVADDTGGFVLFLTLRTSSEPRVLDLIARAADGTERRAENSVILTPPPPPTPVALAEAPQAQMEVPEAGAAPAAVPAPVPSSGQPARPEIADAAAGGAGAGLVAPTADRTGDAVARATLPPAAPAAEPERETASAASGQGAGSPQAAAAPTAPSVAAASAELGAPARAPTVLLAGEDGIRLVQPPAAPSSASPRVIVDAITYDAAGEVVLEGRGAPTGPETPQQVDSVRIYLDNAPVDTAPLQADGSWRLPLEGVASGVYTLRVDQIGPQGDVVSRFETPFQREDPAALARLEAQSPVVQGDVSATAITVQPGYTLWGIATDRYGDGLQYVAIFEANEVQIRDPDLIYPGQVFDLPDIEEN